MELRLHTVWLVMKIINLRGKHTGHGDYVTVDRRSPWGNPFIMKAESDRDDVCARFLDYAIDRNRTEPKWLEALRGRDLACWCAPKKCHAETLMTLANGGTL